MLGAKSVQIKSTLPLDISRIINGNGPIIILDPSDNVIKRGQAPRFAHVSRALIWRVEEVGQLRLVTVFAPVAADIKNSRV